VSAGDASGGSQISATLRKPLSRIVLERYEVGRKQGRILIDLHELLGGPSDAKFIAMPYLTFVERSHLKYYGNRNQRFQRITFHFKK